MNTCTSATGHLHEQNQHMPNLRCIYKFQLAIFMKCEAKYVSQLKMNSNKLRESFQVKGFIFFTLAILHFLKMLFTVSLYVLKELQKQYIKAKFGTLSAVCSGQFTKTMALPCAHKMGNWRNEPLILDSIHSQWQIVGRTLSDYATTHNDDNDDGFSVMLEELRTKYQEWPASKKEIARERIKELINQCDVLFEPITRPPKGRPPKSNNKRKAVRSTRRDPSGFEFVEASCQCGSSKRT